MDVQLYYQKVRQIEAGFLDPFVVVVSADTPDGGKAGATTEVTRFAAARLIVDGKARAATKEETAAYYGQQIELRRSAEAGELASKLQVTLIHETGDKGQRVIRPKG